jgi:hypothetical protein
VSEKTSRLAKTEMKLERNSIEPIALNVEAVLCIRKNNHFDPNSVFILTLCEWTYSLISILNL